MYALALGDTSIQSSFFAAFNEFGGQLHLSDEGTGPRQKMRLLWKDLQLR
jgi:hypothetical protein